MLKKIAHIGIVVPRLDIARSFYEQCYGVMTTEPVEVRKGLLASFVEFENAKFELIQPLDDKTPHAAFLRHHPRGGIHHVALTCDDVKKTMECLDNIGVNAQTKEPIKNYFGKNICFLDPDYTQDILTELCEE